MSNTERENRIANILGTRGVDGVLVRSQATATAEVERFAAAKMGELLDGVLPHIKQIQEQQSLEEHSMRLLEEIVQALR